MSTLPADSPDWFVGEQLQNPEPLVYEHNVTNPQLVTYGPFNVTHWEGLNVSAMSNGVVNGTISWFADAGLTQLIGTQTFQCFGAIPYIDIFPVVAPYVQVAMSYGISPGSFTTSLTILPIRGADPWKKPLLDLNVYAAGNVTIAPGVSTVLPQLVTTGTAHFGVTTTAAVWSAVLLVVTNAIATRGVLCNLGSAPPSAPTTFARVALPATPVVLNLTNGDGVNRTFSYSLVVSR